MQFTGERAILGSMPGRIRIAQEHLARYNFALGILEQYGCKTVLDAACGSGYGTWILNQNGFEVDAVDISLEAVTNAVNMLNDNDNNNRHVNFTVGSLDYPEEIEFLKDRKYDAIVSFETIEHLQNPDKFLEWTKTKTDLLIFSLPINQPSDFHKTVYETVGDAMAQMEKYFDVTAYCQDYMNFYKFNSEEAGYIVGYAKK